MNALKNLTTAVVFAALGFAAAPSMAASTIFAGDLYTDTITFANPDTNQSLNEAFNYTFGTGVTSASFVFDFWFAPSVDSNFKVFVNGLQLAKSAVKNNSSFDVDSGIYTTDYSFNVSGSALHPNTTVKITGDYGTTFDNSSGSYTMSVSAVPEPESYAMLLAGLGLVASIIRRRTKSV